MHDYIYYGNERKYFIVIGVDGHTCILSLKICLQPTPRHMVPAQSCTFGNCVFILVTKDNDFSLDYFVTIHGEVLCSQVAAFFWTEHDTCTDIDPRVPWVGNCGVECG